MSGTTLHAPGHRAETLDPAAAAQHLRDAPLRGDQLIAFGKSSRRAGWYVGGIGACLGLLGMAAGVMAFAMWKPAEPIYALIAPNGEVTRAIRSSDAPQSFTEGTSRQYLRMFVETCESYRFETAKVTSRRCSIMLSPQQQERYAADFAPSNPKSPQARFGRTGEVRIQSDSITATRYGTARGVEFWTIRFVKIETAGRNGGATCRPWMTTVQFAWLPQVEMLPEDREFNLAGFQAVTFDSQPDPVRPPEAC